jgi:hypothetical protein
MCPSRERMQMSSACALGLKAGGAGGTLVGLLIALVVQYRVSVLAMVFTHIRRLSQLLVPIPAFQARRRPREGQKWMEVD